MPDQAGAFRRLLANLFKIFAGRAFRRQLAGAELGKRKDSSENVVELMGDAASQVPGALHPLGVKQLRLQHLLCGNVATEQHDPDGVARPVANRSDGQR